MLLNVVPSLESRPSSKNPPRAGRSGDAKDHARLRKYLAQNTFSANFQGMMLTIDGGDGNDMIVSGDQGGGIVLVGGDGNDIFSFVPFVSSPMGPTISDFKQGGAADIIDVAQINSGDGGAGDFEWGGTTPTANGLWYEESVGNTILNADINGDTSSDFQIVLVGTELGLTAADFIL
jgi:hypothetical protein